MTNGTAPKDVAGVIEVTEDMMRLPDPEFEEKLDAQLQGLKHDLWAARERILDA